MSIKDRDINLGDLALIIHNNKPEKSGWWRKLKVKGDHVYVLEKPIHKNYENKIQEFIDSKSRFENGYFIMKSNTVSYDENKNISRTFNIIAAIRGINMVRFVDQRNYCLKDLDLKEFGVIYTDDFKRLLSYISEKKEVDTVMIVGSNYQD